MSEQLFKIKILDKEFVIDSRLEQFVEIGKNNLSHAIPIGQFKYKDGNWFILWDKAFGGCYNHNAQQSALSIPLTVEWVEVTFLENQCDEKDRLDLIILLSETLRIIKSRPNGAAKRSDGKLKNWIAQFNLS